MHQKIKQGSAWRASFGPFTLSPVERLLERDGLPVRLGGRALDLLIALVESAGEIVSKKDLIARVWPNIVVEEGSLRFHMVAIRKALGEGEGGSRYIVNTANKGYTFVAIVECDGGRSTRQPRRVRVEAGGRRGAHREGGFREGVSTTLTLHSALRATPRRALTRYNNAPRRI